MGNRQERDERIAKAEKYLQPGPGGGSRPTKRPAATWAPCTCGSGEPARPWPNSRRSWSTIPKSALAHYNLAIMFAEAKIYREAIAEWELASKYDPDGDIGDRSRENIKIVKDLMNAPAPAAGTMTFPLPIPDALRRACRPARGFCWASAAAWTAP